jgi:hypothetical protein
LGNLLEGVADAEEAVKRNPKDPYVCYSAARVYAQAAALLQAESGRAASQPAIRGRYSRYQERSVILLQSAFLLMPVDQRPAWQEKVQKDKALDPIRSRIINR